MNNTIIGSVNQSFKEYNDTIVTLIKRNQENIDLASHFKDSVSDKYAKDNRHVFTRVATTKFPESLEVEGLDCQYKMGFLPAIKQLWFTTGTSLFIWNYVDNTEIFKYECSELVENAEIIAFSNHHELVISTTNHIFLHGINQDDKNKLKIISNTCVKTDGVIMSNFLMTDTRRVFMQGNDGHLYELIILSNNLGLSTSCKINCHTASPILRYTSYFFRSVPKALVKSMVVNDKEKFLYFLLSDSSIHSVNIQGSGYLPIQRYNATNLESIHLIPKTESNHINLMAISNKGDRLYFSCKDKKIDLVYTRPSPPLPGSLLFNDLTKETSELSFYNHGVFAAVLGKSKRTYLVMTNANSIRDADSTPVLVEDVYSELVDKKIWSIIENNPKDALSNHYFKETSESPESPARQFSTLTASGITHYIKQRPVDYLSEALSSTNPNDLLSFLKRYGSIETCAMGFLLACSSHQSPQVVKFLCESPNKDEGLLLYFSRVVENIWSVDIMKKDIQQGQFTSVRESLDKLIALIDEAHIGVKDEIVNLIMRTVEAITFICFMHNCGWDKICQGLPSTCISFLFGDIVTTEEGALLSREMIFIAIKTSELSNSTNNYSYISSFLSTKCLYFLGKSNTIYYQGMECIQAAHNDKNNTAALRLSLDHFKKIIEVIQVDTLQKLCQEYCKLGYHTGAIELAYTKYQTKTSPNQNIYEIIFSSMDNAFKKEESYGKSIVEKALQFTNEEEYHNEIYNWLKESNRKELLVTLDTSLLVEFIKTKLPVPESLACLHNYYDHRKKYALAIDCLVKLATRVPDISLEDRVVCLKKACDYLKQPTDIPKDVQEELELVHNEAKIQLNIYNALVSSNDTRAKELATSLKPANTLLHEFAYTHALYEEALCLMDLMEEYNWSYAEKAWRRIIKRCTTEKQLKSKLIELSNRLYPSITSYPVYIIYGILETKHSRYSKGFSKNVLLQAGIPEEVISDAKTLLSLRKK